MTDHPHIYHADDGSWIIVWTAGEYGPVVARTTITADGIVC